MDAKSQITDQILEIQNVKIGGFFRLSFMSLTLNFLPAPLFWQVL